MAGTGPNQASSAAADGESDTRSEHKASVFLSYARNDADVAVRLREALAGRNVEVFRDVDDTLPGEEWWRRVRQLMDDADAVIYVLSPDSVTSENCKNEIEYAGKLSKRIFPVVISRIDWAAVPGGLDRIHGIIIEDTDALETAAGQLEEALLTDIDWVREHTRLLGRARSWEEGGRSRAELLRGRALEHAEQWFENQPPKANPPAQLHRRYITASRDASRSRRNLLIAGLAAGMTIALGLAWFANSQRVLAERNFKVAKEAADGLVFDIAQGLRDVEGLRSASVRKILEQAGTTIDGLVESSGDEPSLLRSRAVMYIEFAKTYESIGDNEQALAAAQKSLQIAKRIAMEQPDVAQAKGDVARAHLAVADALRPSAGLQDVRREFEAALSKYREAQELEPGAAIWSRNISATYGRLAQVAYANGDRESALELFRKGLAADRELVAREPDDLMAQRSVAATLSNLGIVAHNMGDLQAARDYYGDSAEQSRLLLDKDPTNSRVKSSRITALLNLGDAHRDLGDLPAASAAFQEGLDIARGLSDSDPENASWKRLVSTCLNRLADASQDAGDYAAAERFAREALTIREDLASLNPENRAWTRDIAVGLLKLSDIALLLGNPDHARERMEASLGLRRRLVAADPDNVEWRQDLAHGLIKQGDLYKRDNSLASALRSYDEALTIYRRQREDSPRDADALRLVTVGLNRLGEAHEAQGEARRALTFYEEALAIRRELVREHPERAVWQRDLSVSLLKVGGIHGTAGRLEEARGAYEECIAILRSLVSKTPGNTLWATDLIEGLWKLGELEEGGRARELLEEALERARSLSADGRLSADTERWPADIAARIATMDEP